MTLGKSHDLSEPHFPEESYPHFTSEYNTEKASDLPKVTQLLSHRGEFSPVSTEFRALQFLKGLFVPPTGSGLFKETSEQTSEQTHELKSFLHVH